MRHRIAVVVPGLLLLTFAPAAFAQDPGGAKVTNMFEMFLWSDSWIGLGITWGLVIMSLVSLSLTIAFLIQYRRPMLVPDDTQDELSTLLNEKKYREAIEYANGDDSYLGKLASSALSEAANGYGAMERAIEERADAETTKMLRPVEYLNVLGNISPMIGLFGTVYGMILAFQVLVSAGGAAKPQELAAGISTALVTTFWGLVVAIPALAAYAVIRNKIDAITSDGLLVAEDLIAPFKPAGRKSGSSSSAAAATPAGRAAGEAKPRPRATPKPQPSA